VSRWFNNGFNVFSTSHKSSYAATAVEKYYMNFAAGIGLSASLAGQNSRADFEIHLNGNAGHARQKRRIKPKPAHALFSYNKTP
jgi:hypothetical protein